MLRHRSQEVILLEASHRLELIEAQKEIAWRLEAMQEKWRKIRMKLTKLTIATIALILLLTVSAILVALPAATAQDVGSKKTYAFLGVVPNPVGVNQQVLLHVGVTQELQNVAMGWEGLSVTIERPDGETETIGDIRTDSTGGTGEVYTPNQVGIYYLQTHFPEQVTTDEKKAGSMFTGFVPVGTVMLASVSERLELVVQEESIPYYPGQPRPSEYWTRPIDAQLREWSTIAGNWIWGGGMFGGVAIPNMYAPYNEYAPESAHILWTKTLTTGGFIGGDYGPHAYHCGDAYEGKWLGSLVLAGKLYYHEDPNIFTYNGDFYHPMSVTRPGVHAVDLHTGEEIWYNPDIRISFGQIYYYSSFNQHGAYAYLWETQGSTWRAYNPYNGEWDFTIENASSGTQYYGPNGEILIINVNTRNGWMALWNNTAIPALRGGAIGAATGMWRPTEKTVDGNTGYSWNVSIPAELPGSAQASKFGDRVVGGSVSTTEVQSWALSLEPGKEGMELYRKTWNAPAEWAAGNQTVSWAGTSIEEGVFVVWSKETRQYYGFSTETGEYLWTTEPQYYLDFHIATQTAIVYDKLYSAGVSGITYCYDLTTGDRLWTYEATDPYQEILWTNNWWAQILFITDGKLYMGHSEHSPIDPKPRGAPFYCLNATNGEEIFRIDGAFRQTHWGGTAVIGDSIIATMDTYDQRIYAIGKGPSATTITASPKVSVHGSSVLIEGMVTDISPGTKEYSLIARFPNGVPAVADESMSDWMLYVYKQFSKPADASGVTVKIEAYDPNGNYQDLGTATTDSYGNYGFVFEPEVPGQYWISATFEGSASYYRSASSTYLNVESGGITAEEIAQKVLDELPDSPSAGDIAGAIIKQLPEGITAQEVADKVLANLPDGPSAEDIAQEILNQLPEEAEAPAYTTIDLIILVAVVIAIVIGVVSIYLTRKQRK